MPMGGVKSRWEHAKKSHPSRIAMLPGRHSQGATGDAQGKRTMQEGCMSMRGLGGATPGQGSRQRPSPDAGDAGFLHM